MKRQPVFTPIDISAPDIGGTLSSASHFHLTKSPSGITCIPPSNGALKPFDGIIQTKKRFGYPNRFCLVSTKKHRSESERCLVREMGLEPTRQRHTHLKRACLPIPAHSQMSPSTGDLFIIAFCSILSRAFSNFFILASCNMYFDRWNLPKYRVGSRPRRYGGTSNGRKGICIGTS